MLYSLLAFIVLAAPCQGIPSGLNGLWQTQVPLSVEERAELLDMRRQLDELKESVRRLKKDFDRDLIELEQSIERGKKQLAENEMRMKKLDHDLHQSCLRQAVELFKKRVLVWGVVWP